MSEEKNKTVMPSPMDYAQLRDYGLEYLKSISAAHWTDFSVHDPGVTIFEALSLALADLTYRSSAAMSDLLTRKGTTEVSLEGTLFPPQVILSQAPTTIADYRKLVLENIPHVRNVWFEKQTRSAVVLDAMKRQVVRTVDVEGFYDVRLELDDPELAIRDWPDLCRQVLGSESYIGTEKDSYKTLYRKAVRKFLLTHRNLCEDIREVVVLDPVYIGINLDIQLESEADVQSIVQQIYDAVSQYVSPEIRRYSLSEMLEKGRTLDEIYGQGVPRLGFVDREEVEAFEQTRELYISDVIALVMQIDGVKSVRHARFTADEKTAVHFTGFPTGNHISLKPGAPVAFSISPYFVRRDVPRGQSLMNVVSFSRGYFSFYPPAGDGGSCIVRLPSTPEQRVGGSLVPDIPKGSYRGTDRYFSFQNLLPPTYRMGVDTIPESASRLRKAERLQLKAYLTFFDKILSDYLAQIDSFLDLLSVSPAAQNQVDTTYFHYPLSDGDIVDVSKVIREYPHYEDAPEAAQEALLRKNQILNHLMTRFCDSFAEYAVLEFVRDKAAEEFTLRERVEDKKRMLKDYASISSLRSVASDYASTGSVSGVERRILRKLGVNDEDMTWPFADQDKLNLHIIEHNLLVSRQPGTSFLRLTQDDDPFSLVSDPYSFRVTVALPGWPEVCLIRSYREHVERVIREEIPAHILVKICWVSREAMKKLENELQLFNLEMGEENYPFTDSAWINKHQVRVDGLTGAISSLQNIYEGIVIYPDDLDESSADSALRLDFAGLGDDWKSERPVPEPEPEPAPKPEPKPKPIPKPEPKPKPQPKPLPQPKSKLLPAPGVKPYLESILASLLDNGERALSAQVKEIENRKKQK